MWYILPSAPINLVINWWSPVGWLAQVFWLWVFVHYGRQSVYDGCSRGADKCAWPDANPGWGHDGEAPCPPRIQIGGSIIDQAGLPIPLVHQHPNPSPGHSPRPLTGVPSPPVLIQDRVGCGASRRRKARDQNPSRLPGWSTRPWLWMQSATCLTGCLNAWPASQMLAMHSNSRFTKFLFWIALGHPTPKFVLCSPPGPASRLTTGQWVLSHPWPSHTTNTPHKLSRGGTLPPTKRLTRKQPRGKRGSTRSGTGQIATAVIVWTAENICEGRLTTPPCQHVALRPLSKLRYPHTATYTYMPL